MNNEPIIRFNKKRRSKNDARDFAKILGNDKYSVRCVLDAEKTAAKAEIKALSHYIWDKEWALKSGNIENRLIVYFAGHGFHLMGDDFFVFSNSVADFSSIRQLQKYSISRQEIFDEFAGVEDFEPLFVLILV